MPNNRDIFGRFRQQRANAGRPGGWMDAAPPQWAIEPDVPVNVDAAAPFFRAQWEGIAFPDILPEPTGKRGEELFSLILSGIKEIYEIDATIAGGAVRDLAAGVTNSKDVDLFIPLKWKDFKARELELGWSGKVHLVKAYVNEGCVVPSTARAKTRVQGMEIDLVFLDKPLDKDMVATFPIHAQRCVWTLNGGLSKAPEAAQDIENKTFTIDPTITDKGKIGKIVEKINEWQKRPHYKDWKIVLPDVKEWWEGK